VRFFGDEANTPLDVKDCKWSEEEVFIIVIIVIWDIIILEWIYGLMLELEYEDRELLRTYCIFCVFSRS
jgi:hypothetical protein